MNRLIVFFFVAAFALSAAAGTLVQFRTSVGDMDVELFEQDKPITVRNFLRYVTNGLYENTFFHRCIPGFVTQGGGFYTLNRADTNVFWPDNVYANPTFPPITNEFLVGRHITNTFGTIAMAKTSDPNSATSQFFFNLANNAASLDQVANSGGFTVFGRVVRGFEVLTNFNARTKGINCVTGYSRLVDLRCWWDATPFYFFGETFKDLPVAYTGPAEPRLSDLVYVLDVSLLRVQVKPLPNRAREISWKSVAGKTNRVEFTTNLPPVWNVLVRTNGNGTTYKVTDASTNAPRRFYRVRVDY